MEMQDEEALRRLIREDEAHKSSADFSDSMSANAPLPRTIGSRIPWHLKADHFQKSFFGIGDAAIATDISFRSI
jgi:hypothetical protein